MTHTWSEGQLAVHDHVVQMLLLEVMNFASKLSSLLTWQHHWPANLSTDSSLACAKGHMRPSFSLFPDIVVVQLAIHAQLSICMVLS